MSSRVARPGGHAELVAQAVAEPAVDGDGFGEVVLGGQGAHQVAVATLAQRRGWTSWWPARTAPASSVSPRPSSRGGVALRARAAAARCKSVIRISVIQAASSPGRKPRSGTNSATRTGQRVQAYWVAAADSARWMASTAASRSTHAPGSCSWSSERPSHRVGAEHPPDLGQQRVEPGVDGGQVGLTPQRLGQVLAGHLTVPFATR